MNDTLLVTAIEELTDQLDGLIHNDPEGAKAFINTINKVFENPLMKTGSCFIISISKTKGLQLSYMKMKQIKEVSGKPLTIPLQTVIDGLTDKAEEVINEHKKERIIE